MERNIWEIPVNDKNTASILYQYMPDQNLHNPDPLTNKEWYLNNLYYISQFFNLPSSNVSIPTFNVLDKHLNRNELGSFWSMPANRMLYYMTYGIGQQPNLNYNHLVERVDGKHDAIVKWTRGLNAKNLLDKMIGFGLNELTEIKMGADPLSPDAKGRLEEWAEKEMIKVLLRPVVEKELKDFLQPADPNEKQFDSLEAVKEFKTQKYKDHLADTYLDIAKDLWEKTGMVDKGLAMLKYGAACGASAAEWIVENGYLKLYIHEPWQVIFDTNFDEDYDERSRFIGVLPQMTLTDIFKKYPQLGDTERAELNRIAKDGNARTALNVVNNNFPWWGGTNIKTRYYHDFTCTVLRAYWIGMEMIDGEVVETVYTGTLIGNKYLVDFGKAENIVENPNRPYSVQLPIIKWTPNLTLGIFDSFIGRIHGLQDKIDFCQHRAEELLVKAMGRVPSIDLTQIDGVDDVYKLLERIRTTGLIGRTKSNMAENPADHEPFVEMIDMSLNNDINAFLTYKAALETEMQTFVGQTKTSLGENTKYMGQKAYAGTLDQSSTGTAAFYSSWLTGIQRILRYGLNVKKNIYAAGFLEEEALTVIGKKGLKMLDDTVGKYCEDFGIYLKLNDRPSEEFRTRMLEFLKAFVSQPGHGITPGNFLDLEMTPTKSGIKDKWKAMEADIQERANQQIVEKIKADAAAQDKALAHEEKGWAMDAATAKYKADLAAQTKESVTDKKIGADTTAPAPLPVNPVAQPVPAAAPPAPAAPQTPTQQ